jgi:S1-C subfamily serine protease
LLESQQEQITLSEDMLYRCVFQNNGIEIGGYQTLMLYIKQTAVIGMCFIATFLQGCSYSTAINHENLSHELDDSHRVSLTGQLDLEQSNLQPIDGDWGPTSVKLRTDELAPALHDYVQAIFDIPEDGEDPQCLIEVDFDEHPTINKNLACMVTVRVNDATENTEIFNSSESFVIPMEYSAGAGVSDFMSGFTLGLSTPLTIPTRTISQGGLAKKRTEAKLQIVLTNIFKDISEARRRLHYALSREPNDPKSQTSGLITSQFDPYLEAVFVINTRDGIGSGFFVSPDGLALTNEHVVRGNETVSITLRDRSVISAAVLLTDKTADIALLETNISPPRWLKMEELGKTGIGEDLIVIGTPQSLDWSVSKGIVSQLRKSPDGTIWVQTDAALNPGSSGGPMISTRSGEVIAIATMGLTRGDDSGLNFGVHADTVIDLFHELKPHHREQTINDNNLGNDIDTTPPAKDSGSFSERK